MLDNPFPVTSLCKLNHISVCIIQVSTKITCKLLILSSESHAFFWSDPRCFGLLGKFQHNTIVFPDYLSVSCDHVQMQFLDLNLFIINASVYQLSVLHPVRHYYMENKRNSILIFFLSFGTDFVQTTGLTIWYTLYQWSRISRGIV